MKRFGEVDDVSTEIGDVVIVGGQQAGPPLEVHGKKPPLVPATWWPWIIAAGALAGMWWLTREGPGRPKGRAGW